MEVVLKKNMVIVLTVVLAGFAALAAAQQAPDAVAIDPDVHKVLLENEHVRVFEARASHRATSPMHSHPPFVFVSLGTARVRLTLPDGKKAILDTYPGQVMWFGEGLQHSWELLTGEINVIAVEVNSAQQRTTAPLPPVTRKANDSVAIDPDTHHVLLENDHVRIFEGRAEKGAKSPFHSHPPTVLIGLGQGRGKLTLADGKTAILDFTPGMVLWMAEGAEHSWEMLSGEPRVIAVEVKSAHRAMAGKMK